ncbi:MAG: patatin-like phospholipase family protein [Peptoniphilus sp.]|nr:patatin-like phospholipase family protein [Peptoniphilus sp.]MDY6045130.1 patatin-like phospholipase family protein [Peptoniphilus sp.]
MTYGLVLEGGGAKGSYQLGSYMAVQEKHPDIRLVVGTSIGALNGAFIVQGNTDVMAKIWNRMALPGGKEMSGALARIKRGFDPLTLAKTARAASRMDIRPLKELIHRHVDEQAIRNSDIDYGLVVYNVTEAKTEFLYLEDIPRGELSNYILASCCYPVFAPIKIGGKLYADGGIGNNLPYEMVLAKGYDPIILRTNPPTSGEHIPEGAVVIGPNRPIAGTMDFDPERSPERMRAGYRHGLRVLEGYDGIEYLFYPIAEAEAFERLRELFFSAKEDFRYMAEEKGSTERGIVENLWPVLAEELALSKDYSYKQLYLALLEARADQLHMDRDRVYSISGMVAEMAERRDVRPRVGTTLERVLYLLFGGKRLAIE